MKKSFSKKGIEKLFKEKYPNGMISLEKNNMWYCEEADSYCHTLRCSNMYDVAEHLNLVPLEEIKEMKKLAGYYI